MSSNRTSKHSATKPRASAPAAGTSRHSRAPEEPQFDIVNATCIGELVQHKLLAKESCGSDCVIYCVPCFEASREARGLSAEFSVLDLHRMLNPSSDGSLATGLLMRRAEKSRLESNEAAFAQFRQSVIRHLAGSDCGSHVEAAKRFASRKKRRTGYLKIAKTLFGMADIQIKEKNPSFFFNGIVGLTNLIVPKDQPVDKKTSFNEVCHMLSSASDSINLKTLRQVLPSTGDSPQFVLLCFADLFKSLECVLLVSRCETGRPIAVPIKSLGPHKKVELKNVDGQALAKLLIDSLREANVPLDNLTSVVTDSQFLSDNFADELRNLLNISPVDGRQILPVSCSPADSVNLAVEMLNNSEGAGRFLSRFESRLENFDVLLDKYFDVSTLFSKSGRRHFVSRILFQAEQIATRFHQLFDAFEWDEEKHCDCFYDTRQQMFRYDFVADLLCLRDLLAPIKALMDIAENVDMPHWKVGLLCNSVAEYLAKRSNEFRLELYPSLAGTGGFQEIRPGGSYRGVKLLKGEFDPTIGSDSDEPVDEPDGFHHLVPVAAASGSPTAEDDADNTAYLTELRSQADVEREVTQFAAALHRSFVQQTGGWPALLGDAAVMDAARIARLLASDKPAQEVAALAESAAAGRLISAARKRRQLAQVGAEAVASFASAIHSALLSGVGRDGWTTPDVSGRIVGVEAESAGGFDGDLATWLRVRTEGGGEAMRVRLNDDAIYRSMYFDSRVFGAAGRDACLLLDFALHLGGAHGVAVELNATRRSQLKPVNKYSRYYFMEDEEEIDEATVRLRTKLRFLLPRSSSARELLNDQAVRMFFDESRRRKLRELCKIADTDSIAKILEGNH